MTVRISQAIGSLVAAVILSSFGLNAQGFDWQYSPRLPFETPLLFFGLTGEGSYLEHDGSFGFLEDNVPCCNFKRGFGSGYRAAISSEYWYKPEIAFSVRLGYSNYPGDFRMQTSQPVRPNEGEPYIAVYENRYKSEFSYASLELSAKYRLFLTHFFATSSLESGVLIRSQETQTERVVSPDFETFKDGTVFHVITRGEVPGVRSVYAAARIGAGYDFNLGKGAYGTFNVNLAIPLNSLSAAGAWNRRAYSVGVSLMRGFLIDF